MLASERRVRAGSGLSGLPPHSELFSPGVRPRRMGLKRDPSEEGLPECVWVTAPHFRGPTLRAWNQHPRHSRCGGAGSGMSLSLPGSASLLAAICSVHDPTASNLNQAQEAAPLVWAHLETSIRCWSARAQARRGVAHVSFPSPRNLQQASLAHPRAGQGSETAFQSPRPPDTRPRTWHATPSTPSLGQRKSQACPDCRGGEMRLPFLMARGTEIHFFFFFF